MINSLSPGDAVIGIQDDASQLDGYRYRIALFEKKLKVEYNYYSHTRSLSLSLSALYLFS